MPSAIETIRANYGICLTCEKLAAGKCAAHPARPPATSLCMSVGCPLKKFPPIDGTMQASVPPVDTAAMWRELHEQRTPTPAWFDAWLSRVHSIGCSCQRHFAEMLRMWPPDFGPGWFEWSVRVHNLVSASLIPPKSIMSLADARQLYNR